MCLLTIHILWSSIYFNFTHCCIQYVYVSVWICMHLTIELYKLSIYFWVAIFWLWYYEYFLLVTDLVFWMDILLLTSDTRVLGIIKVNYHNESFFKKRFILIYVHGYFACMYVCVPCTCYTCLWRSAKGIKSLWNWSYR